MSLLRSFGFVMWVWGGEEGGDGLSINVNVSLSGASKMCKECRTEPLRYLGDGEGTKLKVTEVPLLKPSTLYTHGHFLIKDS